jgi:chitinase
MGEGDARHQNDTTRDPFLYNGDIFIDYTGEEAVREIAAYAKEKIPGGVMVWEYAHDMDGEPFKILNESVQ